MHRALVRGAGSWSLATICAIAAGIAMAATSSTEPTAEKPAPLRHGVFRFTSYPAAWTAAQETNRPILVFVTSRNCPHCSRMLGETYRTAAVRDFVNGSFETVLVDRSEQPELAAKLRVKRFPTTLVVGPNNKVMDVIEGYVDAKSFSRRLETSIAGHEKSIAGHEKQTQQR
jgi:thioredoxin-like negative regulator of GroEL